MSWPKAPFIEVCNIQGGTQPPKSTFVDSERDGYIRLLQIQDFKRSDKAVYVPDKKSLKKCKANDILIGRYGASVGKVLTGLSGAYNVALVKTLPDLERLDRAYLYHFLCSPVFQNYILNVGSRAAQAGFNKDDLAGLSIPLPPLKEQQRIAAILDKADAIRRKRQQAIALADEFLRAVFLDMFGDPVTNPKGVKLVTLGELCDVATGATPSREKEEYYGGSIPWVKTAEVDGYVIKSTEETITKEGLKNSNCKLNPIGSIVLAMYGQGKTRGKVGILGVEAATNQACAVIKPSPRVIMEYLYMYLRLSYDSLRALGQGAGQPNLNLSIVKGYPVPVPREKEQRNFVDILQKVEKMISRSGHGADEVDVFFNSLSQKAFNGEL